MSPPRTTRSSFDGWRCNAPRSDHVLTIVRRCTSSRWTSSIVSGRMRAQRAIRAMAVTCACTPHTSPTTSASWPRGARRSRWCRRTWNAATWAAVKEGRSRRSVTRIRPRRTGPKVVNVWTPAARRAATVVPRGLWRSGWRGRDVGKGAGIRRSGWDGDEFPSPEPIERPSIHDQPEYDGGSAEDVSGNLRHRERERDFRWPGREGSERKECKPYHRDGDRASDAESERANGPCSGGTVEQSFDDPEYGESRQHRQDDVHERERRVARRIYGERIPQPWEECAGGRCDAHVPQERDDDVNDHRGLALTDARRMFGS